MSMFELNAVGLTPQGNQALGPPGHVSEIDRPRQDLRSTFEQDPLPGEWQAPVTPGLAVARETARALIDEVKKVLQRTNITASLPAHTAPHLYSTPIDLTEQVTVPAAATGYATVIEYTVQPGRWARISGYGMNVTTAGYVYDGTLLWQICVNGVPVSNLLNIAQQRGSIIQPRQTFFVAREGDVVQYQVQRAVAGVSTIDVEMALVGWTWRPLMNKEGSRSSVVV